MTNRNDVMRIGFYGDSIWAQKALVELVKHPNYEVVFVVPRYDAPDEELIKLASDNQIQVILTENINKSEFIDMVKLMKVDLNVSMSFDQIIKSQLIQATPKGFINCHAGELPFYRGRNILNWVLINGEEKFGVTAHYIDEGIDTGDIILQHIEPISIDDNYQNLLLKCYDLCPYVLVKAIDMIYNNKVTRIKQETIHPVGSYYGRRIIGDEIIDWSWDTNQLYNFIRAISYPAPYAQTQFKNKIIKIAKASLIANAPNYISTCGEVVGRNNFGNVVKTGDSTILIERIVSEDGHSLVIPNFSIGSRLGI